MTERPILFSAEMIRAILDGRKTQTRRVVRIRRMDPIASIHPDGAGTGWIAWSPRPVSAEETARLYPGEDGFRCPYGAPGDRLWVREAWRPAQVEGMAWYRADGSGDDDDARPPSARWRPSIYMPRWASRIDLELTSVRVERVQDISEDDARAEGIRLETSTSEFDGAGCASYRDVFAGRWDEINGKRPGCSWESNPYVWCLEFRRIRP